MKLGKLPRTKKATEFKLAPLLPPKLVFRRAVDNTGGITKWLGLGNNRYSNCVWVAGAHIEMANNAANGVSFIPKQQAVMNDYRTTGWDPNVPGSDQGTDPAQMLSVWRNTGICGLPAKGKQPPIAPHKIAAYALLDPGNMDQFYYTIDTFGAVFFGLALPIAARNDGGAKPWLCGPDQSGQWAPGSWGLHMTMSAKYDLDQAAQLEVVTWGHAKPMEEKFEAIYGAADGDAYAVITDDWMNANTGKSPNGFDLAGLQAKLAAL